MRRIVVLEAAAAEAVAAAAWYERERVGLGAAFLDAIISALDLLEQDLIPATRVPGTSAARAQRIVLRRFPFDVVFVRRGDETIVVAFAHHARRPGYWRERTAR